MFATYGKEIAAIVAKLRKVEKREAWMSGFKETTRVFATYLAAAFLGFLIAAALPLPEEPTFNLSQAISQSGR